ncbi:uncharacterized protein [Macrobrachium rosenbergii]|uniref:uncharacterized protein n=1 Tax=Macrobrachium rosenbergii TaxID=79674 RepID=UPI0034D4F1AD
MTIRRIKDKNLASSPFYLSSAKSLPSSAYTSLAPGSLQGLTSISGYALERSTSTHWCIEASRASCSSVQPRLLLHFFLILLHLVAGALSIRVQEMRVPHPGVVERPATLECVYDTGRDNFYSIRWYFKGELFYSFIKGNNPEKINHNHTDVDVAMAHSDTRKVTLREIAAVAEGQYRCEVMGRTPPHKTSQSSEHWTEVTNIVQKYFGALNVKLIPINPLTIGSSLRFKDRSCPLMSSGLPDKPEIRVTRSSYRVGETVEATCTARHSWPAPTLSFSVNGHHIPAESSRVLNIGVSEDKGRFYFPKGSFTSTSMLILPIERRLSSRLRLGCHALVQSLEKASFISVEVESGLSSMFSFFNAGVACWTSDAALITLTLAMLLLLQKQL